jgi:hypothetical protein
VEILQEFGAMVLFFFYCFQSTTQNYDHWLLQHFQYLAFCSKNLAYQHLLLYFSIELQTETANIDCANDLLE